MKTSETISFGLGSDLKLNRYEQYNHLHNEFEQNMFRLKLLPANVLKSFFGVVEDNSLLNEQDAVMPIATNPLPISRCYLTAINGSYLLVGLEIYTLDGVDYQSRFLVEVGYSVSGFMREPARKHFEILNSFNDLEKFVWKFKDWSIMPFFVWEMS